MEPKKINFDNDQAYNSGATIGKEVDTHQPVHTGSFIGMKVVQKGVHQVLHYLTVTKELLEYYQEDQVHVDQVEVIYMETSKAFQVTNIENYLCPGGNCPSSIDGTYTAGPSEYITVENPNGGESLETGDIININWDSNADSNVSIKLYINNTFNSNITTNTTNDGTYTWSIPNSVASGSNYKIKITSNSNSDIYDFSDSTFSITASPSVNLSIGE